MTKTQIINLSEAPVGSFVQFIDGTEALVVDTACPCEVWYPNGEPGYFMTCKVIVLLSPEEVKDRGLDKKIEDAHSELERKNDEHADVIGYQHEWIHETLGGQTQHCWKVDEREWNRFKDDSGCVLNNAKFIRSRRLIFHPDDNG